MDSPLSIGTNKIKIVSIVGNRSIVRFQNVGKKDIYIKKIPINKKTSNISDSDFEIKLHADPGESGKGDSFETNSINAFEAISVTPGSLLAVYQTKFINYE